jgi:hypothetical protein
VDAIKNPQVSRNNDRLGVDRWTLRNNLAISLVIAYDMDRNWALQDVQLAVDKVDRLLFSYFRNEILMIGQEATYWSLTSKTFEGGCPSI